MILVFDNFLCHNGNMEAFDEVLEAVGPRLRSLRVERGTTLAQLSESTGISVSTLSRLESGRRKPTLELLLPLARAHQVQLDELVDAPPTGDPRIHAKPIKRHGTVHIPLSKRPGGLQAFKQILPAGWVRLGLRAVRTDPPGARRSGLRAGRG
jgi:transcriptional regulator with XRE-family HTH domain